ncbi:restriction endonuclease subunit S [Hallella colorans]|uniref:restriction endonuclease subunit S n=1 Tax=Hallella colorans TaxID=1703337 RepID=UPI0023F42212|nr:restriction endonuclease subunit S [Hallella colorans]
MKKYKLGELIEVTRGASLNGNYYAVSGKYIRLTCGNFDYRNNCFKENTSKDNLFYTGEFKEEFLLEKGDLITPLTEQAIGLLGSTAWIPESGKYIQSQDIAKIICNEELLDKKFAYYLISSNMVKQQLSAAAQQTKIRHTSPDKIKDCTVWLPSLAEQKQIGQLLFDIDRKIEINRAINHNLEAMAKQLYDYWFVQFDFPNENGKPYKSSGGKMVWNEKLKQAIPEGWNVDVIGNILDKYPTTKRYETKEYLSIGKYPIVDQGDAYIVGFTNENDNLLSRYPAVLFGDHSTKVKLLDFPFARGADGTQILYSNNLLVSQYYLYLVIVSLQIPNPGYSRHFKYLKELPIVIPHKSVIDTFTEIVKPLYIEKKENVFANIVLTRQRDELLPLLMNGQVSVNYDLSYD